MTSHTFRHRTWRHIGPVAALTSLTPGTAMGDNRAEGIEAGRQAARDAGYHDGFYETNTMATRLIDTAMSDGGMCYTCDFIGFFTVPLANFSVGVYSYLISLFFVVMPILILIWIGWKVAGLMTSGGEDGKRFLYALVTKLALFFVIMLTFSMNYNTQTSGPAAPTVVASQTYVWNAAGPYFLDYGFTLSNEIRDFATAGTDTLNCDNVDPIALRTDVTGGPFVGEAVKIACNVERVHMIGFASGLAILSTSYRGTIAESSSGLVGKTVLAFARALVKVFTGVLIIAVFAISAFWLLFLILDVVVRALVTAAFAPVIAGMFLFQPTRQFAVKAIVGLFAALGTILGLTIVMVLGYHLITNVVTIHNAVAESSSIKATLGIDRLTVTPITDGNIAEQYRTFIARMQTSVGDEPTVPMDLHMPWFLYLVAAGTALHSLGKKIIAMIEGVTGQTGMSAMADKATQTVKTGAMFAGGATAAAGIIASPMLRGAGGLAAGGTKAGMRGLGAAGAGLGNATNAAKDGVLNPFKNVGAPLKQAPPGGLAGMAQMGANAARSGMEAAEDPQAGQ